MKKQWTKSMTYLNHQLTNKQKVNRLVLGALIVQLSACQTLPLKEDAHVEGLLENPTEATQVKEKIDNVHARDKTIKDLLAHAKMAWQSEDFNRLHDLYTQLEAFDPGNLRAKEGFLRIEMAKKHQALIDDAARLSGQSEESDALAMDKLHQVLLENAHHPRALPLYNQLLQKQEKKRQAKLKHQLQFNEPVTMEFRDVDLKKIFEGLSKTTDINFILDKGMRPNQKATIFVKSMAFQDALTLLLQSNKLAKKVLSKNSVIIYENNKVNKREYQDLVVRNFVLNYADAKEVSAVLTNMLNLNKVQVNERLNTLIIRESAEVLALAEKIILSQDFPETEVMLEVQVLEMRRSYVQNLGIKTPTGLSLPVPTPGPLTVRDLKVSGNSLVVNGVPGLEFNATDGDVSLLANPRIRVKNKELAKIHIGERVPVFTSNVASTGVTTQSVQYIDAGLKLEIEPEISPTDDVTIKLNLNVNSIGDEVTATAGNSQSVAFRVGTRLTSTVLRLHDGETQVLAGLIDDQDRKVVTGFPGLAKVPLLGRLFSTQADDKVKTEIVLSITPHIVRNRRLPTTNQSEMWVGSEGRTGRGSPSPAFKKGVTPFFVPKPKAKENKTPEAEAEKPKNINIPLPAGFSLGGGLAPEKSSVD